MTKRNKRYSLEQIVRKIQDADRILAQGGDVVAVLKELNTTAARHYRWRNHSSGLKAEDAKKLKQVVPSQSGVTLGIRSSGWAS